MNKIEEIFQILLVSFLALIFCYLTLFVPGMYFIKSYTQWVVGFTEVDNPHKNVTPSHTQESLASRNKPKQSLTTANEETKNEIEYKDWSVSRLDNLIMYTTHGTYAHGHKFGWIKKVGNCDEDILYLTFSTVHENKDILDKLKHKRMSVKVSFPEVDGVTHILMPEILATNNFGTMKILMLSNINKDSVFDLYMEKLKQVEIGIEEPYRYIFDIPEENWSLSGYVASKLKAKEMCEAIETRDQMI